MTIARLIPLALAAAALAGCGGGGGGDAAEDDNGGGGGGGIPSGGGLNGIAVSNCLIGEDFLVQPSEELVEGSSPGGVLFSLRLYKDEAAAKAAFENKDKQFTALVQNGIIDFSNNPFPYEGAPKPKISQGELKTIEGCINTAKADGA